MVRRVFIANGIHKPSVSTTRGKKEPPAVSTTERCLLSLEISLLSAIAPALTAVDIVLGCNTLETEISKKDDEVWIVSIDQVEQLYSGL